MLLYGKGVALKRYIYFNVEGTDIMKEVPEITEVEIDNFIIKHDPDFIITGTSAEDFCEKYIWKSAEKFKILSFGILDHWVLYGIRFSKYNISEISEYEFMKELIYMPTKVLVTDEYAKDGAIKDGILENKILVSGNPYFDYLLEKKEEIEKYVNKNQNEINILFVSQPLSALYNEDYVSNYYWGYNERTIFMTTISIIGKIAKKYNKRIKMIIKLHPKEEKNNFEDIILSNHYNNISFEVDRNTDGIELVLSSDIVMGISSMLLVEAVILGWPAMSIQIGLKRNNPFILDRINIVKSILNEESLYDDFHDFIINKEYKRVYFPIDKGSIERIINYIEELLYK